MIVVVALVALVVGIALLFEGPTKATWTYVGIALAIAVLVAGLVILGLGIAVVVSLNFSGGNK